MSDGPRLVRIQHRRYVDVTPLDGEAVTVGRHGDNSIAIQEPRVSRFHLRIERSVEAWFVRDLQSAHGTYVNDVDLDAPRALVHGDVICPGGDPAHLLVYLEGADEGPVTRALLQERALQSRHARRAQPELAGECPLCGAGIVRAAAEAPLPTSCPRCARAFVMLAKLEAPQLVRTRFRLALRGEVAGLPCLVREPMPLPLPPGLRAPDAPPETLTAETWTPLGARHEREVIAVASVDDGRIRSADQAGDIRTWDGATGEGLERLAARGAVLALSPDGRTALVARQGGVVLLGLESGIVLGGPLRGGENVERGGFTADGRILLASSTFVTVHSPSLTRARLTMPDHARGRGPVRLVAEDTFVFSAGSGAVARISRGGELARFEVPGADLLASAVEPHDGGLLLAVRDRSARRSQLLRMDLGTGLTRPLVPHIEGIPTVLAVSPDGHLIAWGDQPGNVTCIRRANGATVTTARPHTREVRSLAFDPASSRLVSGGADGRVAVVPLDRSEARVDDAPAGGTLALAVASRAGCVASLARDGVLRVRDAGGTELGRWPVEPAKDVAIDAAGRTVAVAGAWGVQVWQSPSGEQLWARETAHADGLAALVGFQESTGAVIAALRWYLVAWSARDGRELWRDEVPERAEPVAWLPGCEELIAVGAEGEVLVVSLPDRRVVRRFGARSGLWPHRGGMDLPAPIRPRGSSPDGELLALVAAAGLSAVFVDHRTGTAWRPGGNARVSAVAAGPGGLRFAVAYEAYGLVILAPPDFAARARWVPTGELGPFDRRIDALAFSPDGRVLHAGTREGQLLRFAIP